ncbi:TetR/AcrR family transcriptional regulator [Streptomyces sp. Li-HN-5-11]|uniref:TetR/AcrR family transcriptional regulator n=1 Tax=Streptomyces sp. Li-HN-5-11 TaxID=3075432 RepID=UPI0028ABBC50|nr:TetR/AcrR family transcriptional regulator [Streptomyces sp. Li-HN-5-11]WNM31929.1 TetR/AcrR family transcriptional regulator [Streptomyces sp. Li-HN-5-11]
MTRTRREEVLDTAFEMFAERGYRGASLNAIAERVGLTRQGVLHYFPSKEQLLIAMLERREQLHRQRLLVDDAKDWPDQMAEVVAHDHESPGLAQVYGVLLGESVTDGHPAQGYFRDHHAQARERMSRSFTERWGDRLPSGLTPRAAATALLALLDGMQQQWLLDRDQTDHPEIVRDVLQVLFGTRAAHADSPAPEAREGARTADAPVEAEPGGSAARGADAADGQRAAESAAGGAATAGRSRRPSRKGLERREQILRTALEVFAEHGDRGTSFQEIADRIGVTQPALLYYFGTREELLLAVLQKRDELGRTLARQDRDAERNPIHAVSESVRRHMDQPGLTRLFVSLSAAATDPGHLAHSFFANRYREVGATLAEGLRRGQREGLMRSDEHADDMACLLLAAIDGLQIQWLMDSGKDMPGLIGTFVRLCMNRSAAEEASTASRRNRKMLPTS